MRFFLSLPATLEGLAPADETLDACDVKLKLRESIGGDANVDRDGLVTDIVAGREQQTPESVSKLE